MKQFESANELKSALNGSTVENIAVQSVDLTDVETEMLRIRFSKCIFLGCAMPDKLLRYLQPENFIFPRLEVPFNTYLNRLYDKDSLYKDYSYKSPDSYSHTLDKLVYDYYRASLTKMSIKDTLAFRLHDHSITDSLHEFISQFDERKMVAIMGGHQMKRTDPMYRQVAELLKNIPILRTAVWVFLRGITDTNFPRRLPRTLPNISRTACVKKDCLLSPKAV